MYNAGHLTIKSHTEHFEYMYNGSKRKQGGDMMRKIIHTFLSKSLAPLLAIALTACTQGTPVKQVFRPEVQPLKQSQLEDLTLHSQALDKEMKVKVYLPKGYTSDKAFPVLYLIHGYNGHESSWMTSNQIDMVADKLIDAEAIEPLIIVMPSIENSYGLNSAKSYKVVQETPTRAVIGPFEDYLIEDVVDFIDGRYSTIRSKEGRYIGGKSMGGFVALSLGMRHPERFSKIGGHSPALFLPTTNIDPQVVQWVYPSDRIRKERDPLELASAQDLSGMEFYLDCGTEDHYGFAEGVQVLHEKLQEHKVNSTLSLAPGGHDSASYTNNHLEEYLNFYAGKR
jgi:enterochelin esterase-like enzyme